MKKKIKDLKQAIALEIREHKSTFIVYTILRLFVILVAVLQFFNKNYENVFLCILTLSLLIIPSFVQVTFKIELPTTLEIILLLFIFAAEILGEIGGYYLTVPYWDTMLHTMNGFLAAAIGFSLVNLLNKSEKLQFELSPLFMAIVAFSFSMTIGVIWEFFEFGMDQFFGMDTQKDTIIQAIHSVSIDPSGVMVSIEGIDSLIVNGTLLPIDGYLDIGLIDTMQDLIVNFIGAFVFSTIGFLFLKLDRDGHFIKNFLPIQKDEDKDYLKIVKRGCNS